MKKIMKDDLFEIKLVAVFLFVGLIVYGYGNEGLALSIQFMGIFVGGIIKISRGVIELVSMNTKR